MKSCNCEEKKRRERRKKIEHLVGKRESRREGRGETGKQAGSLGRGEGKGSYGKGKRDKRVGVGRRDKTEEKVEKTQEKPDDGKLSQESFGG